MDNSLRIELTQHVIDFLEDRQPDTLEDLHHYAFNENYYVIGYWNAAQWLKKHDIDAFEAIGDVIEWEENTFGEVNLKAEDINAEKIVNLYVYVKGEELLADFDLDQEPAELLAELKESIA